MHRQYARRKYGAALIVFATGVAAIGYQFGTRDTHSPQTPPPVPAAPEASSAGGEAELSSALLAAEAAGTDAECVAAANRLHDIGCEAHYGGVGRGSIALAALDTAGRLYDRVKTPPVDKQVSALATYAEALLIQGRAPEARGAFIRALAVAKERGSKALLADTAFQYADFLVTAGEYRDARRHLNLSLTASDPADRHRVGRCEWMLGVADSDQGAYDGAERHLTRAERLLTETNDPDTRAAVWGNLGDVRLRRGDNAGADAFYRRGLAYWQGKGQKFWAGVFLARRARVALAQGDVTGAQELADRSLASLSASNGPTARAVPLMVLGQVAERNGEYDDAERLLSESLALHRERGAVRGEAEVLRAKVHVAAARRNEKGSR
jgi:tetratricopeptide (TPR) repeat protein